ncbi:hypothetical protein TrST_g4961 [Triparma strigata]|uniref:Uncharacterized protein n=1 Tax=Triparma strigata TaxID=1606541 RepID=A0A9W7EUT8_9STRA|nr:hypothetical protein TrST_g4961 [Triparma strigata]
MGSMRLLLISDPHPKSSKPLLDLVHPRTDCRERVLDCPLLLPRESRETMAAMELVSTMVMRVKREEGAEILSPSLQRVGMFLQMLYLLPLDLLLQKVVLLRAELLPKEVPQKVEVPRKDRRVVLPRKHRRVVLPRKDRRVVLPRKDLRAERLPKEVLPKEVPRKDRRVVLPRKHRRVVLPRKHRRVVLPRKHRRVVLLPEEVPRAVLPRKVSRHREFGTRRAI